MFLLDANVLIRANADFYDLDRIPQFWDWLIIQGNNGQVKLPSEIRGEIDKGSHKDQLSDWLKESYIEDALLLDEKVDQNTVLEVMKQGYQYKDPLFDEDDIQEIGKDAILIAYAMNDSSRVIVTRETSASSKKRGNRKVPDACNDCGVRWTTDYEMYRLLDFRIPPS